jgi:periplasmic divalent cation tolerance protein
MRSGSESTIYRVVNHAIPLPSTPEQRRLASERGAYERHVSVTTTTESLENAQRIASTLLEAHLAGCVQISAPVESHYWWEGRIESAREWRLTIKTRAALLPQLQREIETLHPYQTPQIRATPIVWGHPGYLAWLDEATTAQ